MDKEALARAIWEDRRMREPSGNGGPYANDHLTAEAVVAALGANGYVVVPEPLLKELLTAAKVEVDGFNGSCYLRVALAAVVEAVGPTT